MRRDLQPGDSYLISRRKFLVSEKFRIFAWPCDIFYVCNMHSVNTIGNLLDALRQVHCRLAVPTKLQSSHTIAQFQIISTEVTYFLQVVTTTTTFIDPLHR